MGELLAPVINLLILLGILAYYLRKPLQEFVKTRHFTTRDELLAVEKQMAEAKRRFADYSAKLKAIDTELIALMDQVKYDAGQMKLKILTNAKKLSEEIGRDSQANAQNLFQEFKTKLVSELGESVVARTEAVLRAKMTVDDRTKIRSDFSKSIGVSS